jgi:hypothetical protein
MSCEKTGYLRMAGGVSQELNDVIMVAEEILGQTEDHGLRKINTREIRVSSEGIIRSNRIIQALSGRTIRALSDLLYGLNQVWASGPIQLNLDPTVTPNFLVRKNLRKFIPNSIRVLKENRHFSDSTDIPKIKYQSIALS